MFQIERKLQTEKELRNQTKASTLQIFLFDDIVVALATNELMCTSSILSEHILSLFVSCVIVWPYRKCMRKNELFVFLGSVQWVLRRTHMSTEIFFSIGIMHKSMPVLYALRHMTFYGIHAATKDITTSLYGALAWGLGILYLIVCVFAMYFLFYFRMPVNAKRKLFHGLLFLYYSVFPLEIVKTQTVCLLFLIQLSSKLLETHGHILNTTEKVLLKEFISEKDRKKVISHALLLIGFLFSSEGIQHDRSRLFFVLSSVGIVDGVASFFPKTKGTYKSRTGSVAGALTASFILKMFFHANYPLWMYFLIGAGEYCSQMNDNILLPVLAYGISGMIFKYT